MKVGVFFHVPPSPSAFKFLSQPHLEPPPPFSRRRFFSPHWFINHIRQASMNPHKSCLHGRLRPLIKPHLFSQGDCRYIVDPPQRQPSRVSQNIVDSLRSTIFPIHSPRTAPAKPADLFACRKEPLPPTLVFFLLCFPVARWKSISLSFPLCWRDDLIRSEMTSFGRLVPSFS